MLDPWLDPGDLPLAASIGGILLVFLIAALALDLVLVRWLKIGKIGWKRVDYIWLSLGVLSLVGAVAEARHLVIGRRLSEVRVRAANSYSGLRRFLENSAASAALCRASTQAEFPPPESEAARYREQYEQSCAWFRAATAAIPRAPDDRNGNVNLEAMPPRPVVTAPELVAAFATLDQTLGDYRRDHERLQFLLGRNQQSRLEEQLVIYFPVLLAVAIALRIAKVTGEIREMRAEAAGPAVRPAGSSADTNR
jgi:hypothetical protein